MKTLQNIFDYIDDDGDMTTEEIKTELREYGINVEQSIENIKKIISEAIQKERTTPDLIKELKPNEIFVFGANEAGIHGAGAAKTALMKWGAIYGKGFGLFGKTFAIPTKNHNIQTLPIDKIKFYVDCFIAHAIKNPTLIFLVTEIGCGLAGYAPREIAPLFKGTKKLINVHLPQKFWKILND